MHARSAKIEISNPLFTMSSRNCISSTKSTRRGARAFYSEPNNLTNAGISSSPSMMDNSVIQHLYQVVDDKEAYLNYDHYMNKNSSAEVTGKRSSSRSSSARKQRVVSLSEEDLVDRMLSQFPEFSTNRLTPFTTIDDDDIIDNYSTAGSVAAEKDMGDNNNPTPNHNGTSGEDDPQFISPNSRFFTDDASDMIGKFFFGTSPPTGQSPAARHPPPTPGSSSSSLSTMTSNTAGAPYSTKNKRDKLVELDSADPMEEGEDGVENADPNPPPPKAMKMSAVEDTRVRVVNVYEEAIRMVDDLDLATSNLTVTTAKVWEILQKKLDECGISVNKSKLHVAFHPSRKSCHLLVAYFICLAIRNSLSVEMDVLEVEIGEKRRFSAVLNFRTLYF